jgi:microcystin-dependent protein
MTPYVGLIIMWPCSRIPEDWLVCAGQELSTGDYQLLFTVIGNTYGGGNGTFKLPNLAARVPIGVGQAPGLSKYNLAQLGGSEAIQLTTAQIPPHTHAAVTSAAQLTVNVQQMGIAASASPGTMAVPNNPNNVLAAGASDYDNGNGVIEVYNYGNNTNQLNLPCVNVTADLPPCNTGNNSGGPHPNIQPTMGINYIICTNGLLPPHP